MSQYRRSRRDIAVAGLAGAAFAVIVILSSSGGDVDAMTFGDGRLHRAVAQDLDADDPELQRIIGGSGPALRYGRIGLPALLWLFSAGQDEAMPYVQPIIMVLCAAITAMVTVRILGAPSFVWGLIPFIAIGLTASLAGGFAEPLAIASSLTSILFLRTRRVYLASIALGGAILVRESAVVVLIGVCVWLILGRQRREAAILAAAMVPGLIWHLIVASHFGVLPVRDPWLYETDTLYAPVLGVLRTIKDGSSAAIFVLVVHLILAVLAVFLSRSSVFGMVAAISGVSILAVGRLTWSYIGDATRVAVFLEVFVLLAIMTRLSNPSAASRR